MKRASRRHRCDKKKLSEQTALHAIATAKKTREEGMEFRQEKRMYYCRQCNAYHLTSKRTDE